MGGLTTFSTFSAEIVLAMQEERFSDALMGSFLHVGGSLVSTFLGMLTFTFLHNRNIL